MADPAPWLLLVAGVHLGFQLTIDLVVYPALGEVPDDRWTVAHARHSRRVTTVVSAVYPPLVLVLGWTVFTLPGEVGTWVATAGGLLAVITTAVVAAPTHGRLSSATGSGRAALLRRLDRADRVRSLGALVCTAGALALQG